MKRSHIVAVALFTAITPVVVSAAQLLVLNKSDATLAFIDPESGKVSATIATGAGPHEIELTKDEKVAIVSNYGASAAGTTLSVIDVAKRAERKRVDLGDLRRPHGLSFANGVVYFTAEDSQSIGRFNPKSQRVDWTFKTDQERTHMILASGDGARLYTTNMGSNNVSVIEQQGGEWRQTLIPVGKGPEGLDESPDGRELWVAHSQDGGISVIDPASKKVVATFDVKTKRSNRLKFTPDGKHVLVSDLTAGQLVIIDAQRRSERARLELGRSPTGILIHPDGRQAYVAVSGENRIAVIDLAAMKVVRTLETGNNPDGMALVKD